MYLKMPENMPVLDKIDVIRNCLDKLADAQGRAKCGYIYIIDDVLNKIRDDVLILQEQVKDKNPPKTDEEPEIVIEPVDPETMSQE